MEGDRGDSAPHLFQDYSQVGEGQPLASIGFGQGHAKPAQVRHLFPQVRRIPQVVLLHGAGQTGRAFPFQKFPGQVLDHLLFFAKEYVHTF